MCNEIINIVNGNKLNNDIKLEDNAMLLKYPHLWKSWDFDSNNELDVYKVTAKSHKLAHWICIKCNSRFDMKVGNRTKGKIDSCPYCEGKRVNHTNSLESLDQLLSKEWNVLKNDKLKPSDINLKSSKKVWWVCSEGHEWEARVNSRSVCGNGCPYCSGRSLLLGFNDMWTSDKELAKLLLRPEDGHCNMRSTSKKLDWKCPNCNEVIKGKSINNVSRYGIRCHICNDSMSFGEKIVYQLLKLNNVNFEYNKSTEFSDNKRYDFVIEDLNLIIETHGKQHYENTGFQKLRGRDVCDEKFNDLLKKEKATINGYEYVEVDCRVSDFNYIKNNMIDIGLIDKLNVNVETFKDVNMSNSLIIECWSLWDKGKSKIEISKILKIGRNRVARYIKLKECRNLS